MQEAIAYPFCTETYRGPPTRSLQRFIWYVVQGQQLKGKCKERLNQMLIAADAMEHKGGFRV